MLRTSLALLLIGLGAVAIAGEPAPALSRTTAPDGARIYIISPTDGTTVGADVTVLFGLHGMGVAPAGVDKPNTGHHHLLIDVTMPPEPALPIPADDHHLHFGGGQTETTIHLTPGTHTLQLELADAHHIPFNPPLVSKKITIHVGDAEQ